MRRGLTAEDTVRKTAVWRPANPPPAATLKNGAAGKSVSEFKRGRHTPCCEDR